MQLVTRGILFSHIPKTAGTSFRVATNRYAWGWKVYSDYDMKSRMTSRIIRTIYETGDVSRITSINSHKSLLAGHFPIKKYIRYYPVYRVITFMRDPVQRIISHYYDLQRRIDYSGSLEEFVNDPRFQNNQCHFFEDVPLEAVGAVGISEFYDESLELFDNLYALKPRISRLNSNKSKKELFYMTTGKMVEEIRRLNSIDYRLYNKALRIFLLRRHMQQKQLPYVYGRIDGISDNTVRGWAVDPLRTGPVKLEVMLNDQPVTQLDADISRPELQAINIARDGQVGFSCTLDKPLSDSDRIDIRVYGTHQPVLA